MVCQVMLLNPTEIVVQIGVTEEESEVIPEGEQGLPVLLTLAVEAGLEAALEVEVAEAPLSLLISPMLTLTPRKKPSPLEPVDEVEDAEVVAL